MPAGEADPVAVAPVRRADGDFGVEVDGYAEVVRGGWGGDLSVWSGEGGVLFEFHDDEIWERMEGGVLKDA